MNHERKSEPLSGWRPVTHHVKPCNGWRDLCGPPPVASRHRRPIPAPARAARRFGSPWPPSAAPPSSRSRSRVSRPRRPNRRPTSARCDLLAIHAGFKVTPAQPIYDDKEASLPSPPAPSELELLIRKVAVCNSFEWNDLVLIALLARVPDATRRHRRLERDPPEHRWGRQQLDCDRGGY